MSTARKNSIVVCFLLKFNLLLLLYIETIYVFRASYTMGEKLDGYNEVKRVGEGAPWRIHSLFHIEVFWGMYPLLRSKTFSKTL